MAEEMDNVEDVAQEEPEEAVEEEAAADEDQPQEEGEGEGEAGSKIRHKQATGTAGK